MKIKKCNRCHNDKSLESFAKNKRSKDGLNPTCRECKKEMRLKKVKFNQENRLIPENGLKVCNKCKEEKSLDNFCKNKNTIDGFNRCCKLCKQHLNIQNKQYNIDYYYNNKEKYQDIYYPKQNNLKREKYKNNPTYKTSRLLRSRLYQTLKSKRIYKNNSTIKLLGCSFDYCKQHIESQFKPEMNWSNLGEVWEIDHILPCDSFNLLLEKEQKKCFHFSNLQPLFKTTQIAESFGYKDEIGNRNKSDKIL
jgi:hypothetical protein